MFSHRHTLLSFSTLAALAAGCSSGHSSTSVTEGPSAKAEAHRTSAAPTDSTATASPILKEWQKTMAKTPSPKKGCFIASHPSTQWVEVPCGAPSKDPILPSRWRPIAPVEHAGNGAEPAAPPIARKTAALASPTAVGGGTAGPSPALVGNSNDVTSGVTSGLIASVEGSFPFAFLSDVTGESDNGNVGAYSLQLNTNGIPSTVGLTATLCSGASQPRSCTGWEQFVYEPQAGTIYIEYWLLNYNNSCPSGWSSSQNHCYINSSTVSAPDEPISNLGGLTLEASAGSSDEITFSASGNSYRGTWASVLSLDSAWTASEFNVFGDYNLTNAGLNAGAQVAVQVLTTSVSPTTTAPVCNPSFNGYTGETNSLTLEGSCCAFGGSSPGILFAEGPSGLAAPFACPVAPQCTYDFSCNGGGQIAVTCTPDANVPADPITIYNVAYGQNQEVASTFPPTTAPVATLSTISAIASGFTSETLDGCTSSIAWEAQNCDPTPTTVAISSCVGVSCGPGSVYDASGACVRLGAPGCSYSPATLPSIGQRTSTSFNGDMGQLDVQCTFDPNNDPITIYVMDNGTWAPIVGYNGSPFGYTVPANPGQTQSYLACSSVVTPDPDPVGPNYVGCDPAVSVTWPTHGPCVGPTTCAEVGQVCGTLNPVDANGVSCGVSISCATCPSATPSCAGDHSACCPTNQVASSGLCCATGQVASNGHCCPSGSAWNDSSGQCVEVVCPAGTIKVGDTCVLKNPCPNCGGRFGGTL